MEIKDGIKTYHASTRQHWRKWLEKNHKKEKSVWLIIYKKDSGTPSVYYPEAVDEALCFGWIDSKPNKRDRDSYYQFFARRNPKSNWSKLNKTKVARLMKEGLIMPAGREMIKLAKLTGTWTALDQVDKMELPDDLRIQFDKNKTAFKNWQKFPPSSKKIILEWIRSAKQSVTREKRITESVSLAARNIRANHYWK